MDKKQLIIDYIEDDKDAMEVIIDQDQWYFIKKRALLDYVRKQGFDLGRNHGRGNVMKALLSTPKDGCDPNWKIEFHGYRKHG